MKAKDDDGEKNLKENHKKISKKVLKFKLVIQIGRAKNWYHSAGVKDCASWITYLIKNIYSVII